MSRQRYSDLPKPDASEGVGEWARKIKALQQQVDADEEAEHKRLQDEIAASRIARKRRSRGVVSPTTTEFDSSITTDRPQQQTQAEPSNAEAVTSSIASARAWMSAHSTASTGPVSLAAFMGGRATGPILNKHAPQQDAHDPTLFDQRARSSAPHPVFGTGGVAMPGMASRTSRSRERTSSTPSVRPVSPQKTSHRDRTTSTPGVERDSNNILSTPPPRTPTGSAQTQASSPSFSSSRSPPTSPPIPTPSLAKPILPQHKPSFPPHKPTTTTNTNTSPAFLKPPIQKEPTPSLSRLQGRGFVSNMVNKASQNQNGSQSAPTSTQTTPDRPGPGPQRKATVLDRWQPLQSQSQSPSQSPKSPPPSANGSPKPLLGMRKSWSVEPTPQPQPQPQLQIGRKTFPPPSSSSSSSSPSLQSVIPPQGTGLGSATTLVVFKPPSTPTTEEGEDQAQFGGLDGGGDRGLDGRGGGGDIVSELGVKHRASTGMLSGAGFGRAGGVGATGAGFGGQQRHNNNHNHKLPAAVPATAQPLNHPTKERARKPKKSTTTRGGSSGVKHEHDNENEKSSETQPPVFQQSQSLPNPSSNSGLSPSSTSTSATEPRKPSPSLFPSPSPIPIAVSRSSSNGPGSGNVGRITDRWTEQGQVPVIIGVKPVGSSSTSSSSLRAGGGGGVSSSSEPEPLKSPFGGGMGMVGRRALPGLVSTPTSTPTPGASAFPPPTDTNTSGRGVPLASRTSPVVSSSQHSESPPSALVSVSPTPPSAVSTSAAVSKYPFSSSSPSESARPTASSRPMMTKPNTRIPSTGNRATVMDVAQAFGVGDDDSETQMQTQRQSWSPIEDSSAAVLAPEWEKEERLEEKEAESEEEEDPEDPEPLSLKFGNALRQNTNANSSSTSTGSIGNPYQYQPPAFISSLQRRSSYNEKYSAIASALPPLKEEATPISTPAGTLRSGSGGNVLDGSRGENRNGGGGGGLSVGDDEVDGMNGVYRTDVRDMRDRDGARIASEVSEYASDVVQISHSDDVPLPKLNIDALLKEASSSYPSVSKKHTDAITISVEVLVISGSNATVTPQKQHQHQQEQAATVFYDAEILAVIHRSKSKSSGLVSTAVWGWFGKNTNVNRSQGSGEVNGNELERRKLEELAKRYGTSLIIVNQYEEPFDMLRVLGNKLAVRQGKRTHWSADNTAMHVVRSRRGVVFIDELDLNIRNLCSGFSYCLTVLGTIYVWYGRGSLESERTAALAYGRSLGEDIVEVYEGQSDGAEMFWAILGDDAFANANYWQWRPSVADDDIIPRVWVVSEQKMKPAEFMNVRTASDVVQLVDCVWELFVVVGSEARAQRRNIKFALHVASELVKRVAEQKPYTPSIHVVVLPSQIPLDLKLHFRELDESLMNVQDVPDHMNLLSLNEAQDHLQRKSWERFSLRDPLMLPLGIHPELLQ